MALGVNYALASECVGNDCELSSLIVKEEIIEEESVDVLKPQKTSDTLWASQTATTDTSYDDCEYDYNCPFATTEECDIWYKKPIYKESVAPREPRINPFKVDEIIYALESNTQISANNTVFAPLVERYKMLMNASKACCTDGIIYKMRNKNTSDKQVYSFLKDDANNYAVGSRCLVMNDDNIAPNYSNGVDGEMVTDVRNTCLCKNRQWFKSLLTPFDSIYKQVPSFKTSAFEYNYTDGMNRNITVSINEDVQNTLNLLANCPD